MDNKFIKLEKNISSQNKNDFLREQDNIDISVHKNKKIENDNNIEKINKNREKIINLFDDEKSIPQVAQKTDGNISVSKNIEYHKNLASVVRVIEYEKKQMGTTGFASLGYSTFFEIVKFLGEQGVNGTEFLLEKLKTSSVSNERLAGITDIKPIILENDQPGYVVKIDKSKWVGAFYGPGIAFVEFNTAFVADGLSKRSVKLIEDHEVYHLNNPKAGETETVINSNLKKDFIGSAIVLLESCINMPRWIINNIKEIKKENKNHTPLQS